MVEVASGQASFRARLPAGTRRVGDDPSLTLPENQLCIYKDRRLVA